MIWLTSGASQAMTIACWRCSVWAFWRCVFGVVFLTLALGVWLWGLFDSRWIDNATNLERIEKHFACVSWELIMCMEYLPVLRSEICVLRACLGILFQTASWRPSKIDSADLSRQLAGVPEWFDVAFDVAVVFCVCQGGFPMGFSVGFQRLAFVVGLLAGVSAYVQARFAKSCSELQDLQEL